MRFTLALAALVATCTVNAASIGTDLVTLQLSETDVRRVTVEEKQRLKKAGTNFIDITNADVPLNFDRNSDNTLGKRGLVYTYPSVLTQQKTVNYKLGLLDQYITKDLLQKITSFHTRFYDSEDGFKAAMWIRAELMNLINEKSLDRTVKVDYYNHKNWQQPTVIAKIPGQGPDTIVLSASLDSIAFTEMGSERFGSARAPGADANGSGAIALMETFRLLLTDSKIPLGLGWNTIEFHWYAASESGFLGSREVLSDYFVNDKLIAAILHLDKIGYHNPSGDRRFGVVMDQTNRDLTNFIELLILQYCNFGYTKTADDFASSDHTVAYGLGYPVARVMENSPDKMFRNFRTSEDVSEIIDFLQMDGFMRLAFSFIYELAHFDMGLYSWVENKKPEETEETEETEELDR
ncbi:putative leucine aminopeptidase 1 [Ceratocystis platani]|uniref:Peptide hydrolase n=1 Tax=Ceratocystis fimbriata f. sp. platani TaxID=88771 RepID=A0A0F8BK20_CERFI|nr:putative leucine aminopeptidase 1 [Ceratocystis platani]